LVHLTTKHREHTVCTLNERPKNGYECLVARDDEVEIPTSVNHINGNPLKCTH